MVERGAHIGPNVYVGRGVRVPAGTSAAHAALLEASAPKGELENVIALEGSVLKA